MPINVSKTKKGESGKMNSKAEGGTQSLRATDKSAELSARDWSKIIRSYGGADTFKSINEIALTLLPFIALWLGAWYAIASDLWILVPLLWLAGGVMLVRLFVLQHDCGHGAFFNSKSANDWVGRIFGVITLTPYDTWRHAHAMHHAGSGHLDHRGIGDIDTLTVKEYFDRGRFGRFKYRLYRHPLVLFGVGPAYQFLLRNRLPAGPLDGPWTNWRSTLFTNLVFAIIAIGLVFVMGWKTFLLVQIPITIIAASIGIWLFYIQHQFEDTVWEPDSKWDRREAALHGSSYYDLPNFVHWLTANIGIHHVHHLCSNTPCYRLKKILDDHPELKNVGRLSVWESLGCVKLALWDEVNQKLVSFKTAHQKVQYS